MIFFEYLIKFSTICCENFHKNFIKNQNRVDICCFRPYKQEDGLEKLWAVFLQSQGDSKM